MNLFPKCIVVSYYLKLKIHFCTVGRNILFTIHNEKKDITVFGQNLKVLPIVLLLLFEALNTPTNKLYNTSMRDATQWVNLQHFVQKRVVKITL